MESRLKENIDRIISDLTDDKPIASLLLRAQVIAHELGNEEFSEWIKNEQNGYPNAKSLPDYRVLNAGVKANISIPYSGVIQSYPIPIDLFENETIRECMSHVWIISSLPEIETMCGGREGKTLISTLPSFAYAEINNVIQRGNVLSAYQELPLSSYKSIIEKFKSRLLSFFLKLDKEVDAGFDFAKISTQQRISQMMGNTYNVNAVNVNMGDGSITTGNVEATLNQSIDSVTKEKLMEIIAEIEEEASKLNNDELNETIVDIKEEMGKPNCKPKFLRKALNTIRGIAVGIVANELTPLVSQALGLLG